MIDFEHRHSAHCESGATANLLAHHGMPLSEAMAFGIGAGLFFGHFPMVKVAGLPLTTFRNFVGGIFSRVTKRLGVRMSQRRFRSEEKGMAALDEVLDQGIPVGLQAGVYWLPYFPPALRHHFNAHNLVVYGKQDGEYLVSDPNLDVAMTISAQDLVRARFAKGPLAPKGRMYWVRSVPAKVDLRGPAVQGLVEVARRMTFLPVPLIGTRGMRFLARRMRCWPEWYGQRGAARHMAQLIRMQEEIGTGGAGFRFIFAAFLQETAGLLAEPRLTELSASFTAAGDAWRDLALMGARLCKGRAGQGESYAAAADLLEGLAGREDRLFREIRAMAPQLQAKAR